MQSWGLQISKEMETVPARVLPPPKISYNPRSKSRGIVQERDLAQGSWNLRDQIFMQSGRPLASWAVVNFSRLSDAAIQTFMTECALCHDSPLG